MPYVVVASGMTKLEYQAYRLRSDSYTYGYLKMQPTSRRELADSLQRHLSCESTVQEAAYVVTNTAAKISTGAPTG